MVRCIEEIGLGWFPLFIWTGWGINLSCRLSSCWSIYEKTLLKIRIFLFFRIFLACFHLTLLFSIVYTLKNTKNRIFSTSFFIALQYLRLHFHFKYYYKTFDSYSHGSLITIYLFNQKKYHLDWGGIFICKNNLN